MRPAPLVRSLMCGLVASILLPILLSVTLGTASLLAAVGDGVAAAACRWTALAVGVLWIVALAATTVMSGLVALARVERGGRHRRRRRDGHRLRPRDAGR